MRARGATGEVGKAQALYGDRLGLDRIMDHGWFQTYGSAETMTVQLSFGSQGGSGTAVPDLSIEVDDLDGIEADAAGGGAGGIRAGE